MGGFVTQSMDALGMTGANDSPKDQVMAIVAGQPDGSSYEEILRAIVLDLMVTRGLADSETGRTIGNEEMSRRIRSFREAKRG